MKKNLVILLCACMLMTGCGDSVVSDSVTLVSTEPAVATSPSDSGTVEIPIVAEPVEVNTSYEKAAYLADQVYAMNPSNTLVSPLSLDMALGLAAEGASDETAEELYQYLGSSEYTDFAEQYMTFAEKFASQSEKYNPDSAGYTFQYQLANSIWVSQRYQLQQAYRESVTKNFRAESDSVDFINDAKNTADRINFWCGKKTNGLIPKIVDPNMFSNDLAAILINSIYFESPWLDKWGQTEHSFTDINGKETTQNMLVDTLSTYYENEQATAFSKSYYNGFQFIGILPKAEGDFQISDLNLEGLLKSGTNEYDVHAIAPKLNFETATNHIVDILKSQGMTQPFSEEKAAFDKMLELSDAENLYISQIIQKCKIELDENGTRAAAVTAIMMQTESCMIEIPKEVKEVILDRPFAFLIYDSVNDKILFVGKVVSL